MSIPVAKGKQDRRYSAAGVGVGVGETFAPGFAGGMCFGLPFSSGLVDADAVGADPAADADAEADGETIAFGETVGLIVTFLIGSISCARDFFGANVFGFTFGCSSPSFTEAEGEVVALVLDEVVGELLGETETDGVDLGGGVIFRWDVPAVAAGVDETVGDGDDDGKGLAVLIGLKVGNVDSFDLSPTVCSGVDVGVADGASVADGFCIGDRAGVGVGVDIGVTDAVCVAAGVAEASGF